MKPHAVLLLGALVLLGGCLGGGGLLGGATDGQTAQPTTNVDTERPGTDDSTAEADDSAAETTTDDENVTATFLVEDGENPTVTLEVANDSDEREEGLMHRESLPEDHGMVFVYEDADSRAFWMKNTYVPLDIIFVAPNGTVLNVEHATPGPEDDGDLDRYRSDGDAQYVVELERGFANETGVEAGTELVFNESVPEAEYEGWL